MTHLTIGVGGGREVLRTSHTSPNISQLGDNFRFSPQAIASMEPLASQVYHQSDHLAVIREASMSRSLSTGAALCRSSDFFDPSGKFHRPSITVSHANLAGHSGDKRNTDSPSGHMAHPIVQVSSEYMRAIGFHKPFKNFLSRRKTEAQMPPLLKQNGRQNGKSVGESLLASSMIGPSLSQVRSDRQEEQTQANMRYRLGLRKRLHVKRNKLCEYSLIFAMLGIFITVIEAEVVASGIISKGHPTSDALKSCVVGSTVVLTILIFFYHVCEIQLSVIDSGADDWRVAITWSRIAQMCVEELICVFCPFPGTGRFTRPFIAPENCQLCCEANRHSIQRPQITDVETSVDVLLTIPMFLRCYLIGRFMVLHSHQFQDAATRSIAALNRVKVDFKFVLKTKMQQSPLRVLIVFAVCYWISISWLMTICERTNSTEMKAHGYQSDYLNSLWFVVITFMTIGYGDIVPSSYCGRALAVATGIFGAGVSSALIAVISRKLDLSKAEKHVNAFMADSKLAKQRKNTAATVLQQMWFIYKLRYLLKSKDEMRIRLHQRKFLSAINEFRRVKWEQRKLTEQSNMLIDIAKVQADMAESLCELQQSHKLLLGQLLMITDRLNDLKATVCRPSSVGAGGEQQSLSVSVPRRSRHFRQMASCESEEGTEKSFSSTNANVNVVNVNHNSLMARRGRTLRQMATVSCESEEGPVEAGLSASNLRTRHFRHIDTYDESDGDGSTVSDTKSADRTRSRSPKVP